MRNEPSYGVCDPKIRAFHGRRRRAEIGLLCLIPIGSTAAAEAHPVTRFIRDLRVACLHGLIRHEPQAENYGRMLLGIEKDVVRWSQS